MVSKIDEMKEAILLSLYSQSNTINPNQQSQYTEMEGSVKQQSLYEDTESMASSRQISLNIGTPRLCPPTASTHTVTSPDTSWNISKQFMSSGSNVSTVSTYAVTSPGSSSWNITEQSMPSGNKVLYTNNLYPLTNQTNGYIDSLYSGGNYENQNPVNECLIEQQYIIKPLCIPSEANPENITTDKDDCDGSQSGGGIYTFSSGELGPKK